MRRVNDDRRVAPSNGREETSRILNRANFTGGRRLNPDDNTKLRGCIAESAELVLLTSGLWIAAKRRSVGRTQVRRQFHCGQITGEIQIGDDIERTYFKHLQM